MRADELAAFLAKGGLRTWPIDYPVIPRGQDRVRIIFHVDNTEDQIEELARLICCWAEGALTREIS